MHAAASALLPMHHVCHPALQRALEEERRVTSGFGSSAGSAGTGWPADYSPVTGQLQGAGSGQVGGCTRQLAQGLQVHAMVDAPPSR